jgi:16S rRNA (guanine966-N2)-methyltransferase|tara:strand:- start:5118 stop:5642 length:525 start_codon:yes stop_codon:yes gene_type:complete
LKNFQYKKSKLRPTTSKVIGAVFSILGHDKLEGKNFLDLYSGTGAIGLKALEYGVQKCFFVDKNISFLKKIQEKINILDLTKKSYIVKANCETQLKKINEVFDFVYADPPYDDNSFENIVNQLINNKLVFKNTKLVFEHSSRLKINESINIFNMIQQKKYGDSMISIFAQNIKD